MCRLHHPHLCLALHLRLEEARVSADLRVSMPRPQAARRQLTQTRSERPEYITINFRAGTSWALLPVIVQAHHHSRGISATTKCILQLYIKEAGAGLSFEVIA